jgi:hypothetical protein
MSAKSSEMLNLLQELSLLKKMDEGNERTRIQHLRSPNSKDDKLDGGKSPIKSNLLGTNSAAAKRTETILPLE